MNSKLTILECNVPCANRIGCSHIFAQSVICLQCVFYLIAYLVLLVIIMYSNNFNCNKNVPPKLPNIVFQVDSISFEVESKQFRETSNEMHSNWNSVGWLS